MASHPTANAAMANHEPQSTQPTCQNCSTSTTPLWRRDEMGSVLCNACGLFLKLHGRPRPISLKTDVIKSRNRVKTMRPDMAMKKKSLPATHVDPNGVHMQQAHDNASAALAAVRRASQQHKTNGHGDDSPVSRTGTPAMYDPHLPVFQGMDGHQFQSPSLPQYSVPGGGSPGRPASPSNGEHQHMDMPQTHEQLIAANSSLKTRVSELELVNELYRGRLAQLEQEMQNQDNYHHQAKTAATAEAEAIRKQEDTQRQLDESHRRENILKRRLDEIEHELELKTAKEKETEQDRVQDKSDSKEDSEPPAKRARVDEDKAEEPNALSTPLSNS